ncbi:monovalent cation/H(+) antiporter subunit G [Parvularcula dongshanensis]|uniref:Multicomponent Na+:H+ antiporter subunit G n=1 Tax=Parvularcula dongshanensis TaxID=1173995 RepID=A0A840I2J8_9PROT|nr:monovalent cation/H(+) antiporter subunit G [Parvularcula dongshanensis]MBB4658522.1 multicomponent Na+:H+ antiporter subunit G [Parvularcula dongshanensis]
MIDVILDVLSRGLFLLGGLLVFAGALGVLRFPDFYTRMHAAGVTDTMGADLVLLAMALQADDLITIVKLFFIFVFLVLTSPVSTHAAAHAAFVGGLRPLTGADLTPAEEGEGPRPVRAARRTEGAS